MLSADDVSRSGSPTMPGSGVDGTPELLSKYLADIGRGKLLDCREEHYLARRIRAGDPKARRRLIKKNLRLIVSVAKKYRGMGLPFAQDTMLPYSSEVPPGR